MARAQIVEHISCCGHTGSSRFASKRYNGRVITDLIGNLSGQRFTNENIVLPYKIINTSFYQMVFREYLEEVGIGFHTCALEQLVIFADERLPQHSGSGRCLHIRDIHLQFLLVPVSQPQELLGSQHKRSLPLRRLVCHFLLLYHIGANQNHERQAHGQPHRLDGGV